MLEESYICKVLKGNDYSIILYLLTISFKDGNELRYFHIKIKRGTFLHEIVSHHENLNDFDS